MERGDHARLIATDSVPDDGHLGRWTTFCSHRDERLRHGVAQDLLDDREVRLWAPAQSALGVRSQFHRTDYDQAQAIRRYQGVAPRIVESTLLTTVYTADGHPIRLVEERRRLVMLAFALFYHEVVVGPEGINRKLYAMPRAAWIAEQPVESVLALPPAAEDLIAQVEYVGLIAVLAPHSRQWFHEAETARPT